MHYAFLTLTCWLLLAGGTAAEEPVGRAYFVSPSGSDLNPGTREEPWQTIDRANQADLEPGDRLLFEGGQVFSGTLQLDLRDSGTETKRVLVSSFGTGMATIDGGAHRAVTVDGTRYLTLRKLRLVGSGRKGGNVESGLHISGAEGIEVDSLKVSGFRRSGVFFTGVNKGRFTGIHAYQNGFAGISSKGEFSEDIYIGYCLAENNPGDPTILGNHSGNGIVLGKVRGGVIEYCEARNNGWDMPRKGNGPVGIWSYHSDRMIIQYNISHHNRSTGIDGGGFDFDGGMTNSVMQFNYSHNNHGSGYLICQYKGAAPFHGNTVRYNISLDDGMTNHDAGIHIWQGGVGMEPTDVYNNTIYNTKGSAVSFGAASEVAENLPIGRFFNNIFVTGESQIAGGGHKGEFKGNLYWAMGDGGFLVDGYGSLEAWAEATGQETLEGKLVGVYADPLLARDGTGLLFDPLRRLDLTEFLLSPTSPAVDRALDLRRLFGIDPGETDFFAERVPQGGIFDIGAHEVIN